jgi:hypothetical protein
MNVLIGVFLRFPKVNEEKKAGGASGEAEPLLLSPRV